MDKIIGLRNSGKTTDLVRLCYKNNGVLIVPNEAVKKSIIKKICDELNINNKDLIVFTPEEYLKKTNGLSLEIFEKDLYIDEALLVLQHFFKQNIACVAVSQD